MDIESLVTIALSAIAVITTLILCKATGMFSRKSEEKCILVQVCPGAFGFERMTVSEFDKYVAEQNAKQEKAQIT